MMILMPEIRRGIHIIPRGYERLFSTPSLWRPVSLELQAYIRETFSK